MIRSVSARWLVACLCVLLSILPREGRADDGTVTLWHAYTGAEEEGLRRAIAAFQAARPGVRVEVLAVAFGAYGSKLESAIVTGNGPDVFIEAHERLSTYVAGGYVVPYAPRGGVSEKVAAEYEPFHLDALSESGSLYGLPMSVKCAALYVNAGLVAEPPASLEDIAALRASLPEGTYPLVLESENPYYVLAFAHAHGARMIDDQGSFALGGPEAERALEQIRGYVGSGVIPEEASGELVKRLFTAGKAATAVSGPWLAPDLPPDLRWRVVPLPPVKSAGGSPAVPFATIEAGFLAKTPSDEPLARDLLEFLAGPEGALLRATVGRQIVASRSVWARPELASDGFLATFREAGAKALPMPSHPNMRMTWEPTTRALRKILRGGEPIDRALAEARRRFEDVTRPPPPPASPTPVLLLLGVLLLGVVITAVRRAQRPEVREAIVKSLPAYRWVAHAAIAVGALVIAPLVVGAATSLFSGRGTDLYYVGFANYLDILTARGGELFASGSFWLVLVVTVLWTVLNLALHVGIGMVLALLLNRPALRLRGAYRVVLILPWAVPSYVTALAWKGMFHRQMGAVNVILEAVGAEPVSWFAQWTTAFSANLVTNVWLGFPFMMVVTLGALTAIPKDLYEAAAVDGATAWQRFRLITMPMLRVTLAPAVAMGAVWTFNMFNVVFLVSGGEPDGSTEILVSEAYRWAFTRSQQYGYAAAYAVLIFAVLLIGTRGMGKAIVDPGGVRG